MISEKQNKIRGLKTRCERVNLLWMKQGHINKSEFTALLDELAVEESIAGTRRKCPVCDTLFDPREGHNGFCSVKCWDADVLF